MKKHSLRNKIAFAAKTAMAITLSAVIVLPVAMADSFPDRPITYVIPFPPGGSTDTTGRLLAEGMSELLGQRVIVENRGGAGGNIGAAYVAKTPGDGYTLLQGTIGTHGVNPSLYANMPFDAQADFVPIARMTAGTNVLVVNPDVPVNSVKEFIELAKQKPGSLNMGSSGAGSSIHMSGELFQLMTGTELTHVPYRGGGPAMNDLLAGHIQLMFDNINVSLPHIKSGTLRALAVTSAERLSVLPDVPTMAEAGVPGYEMTSWSGVFAAAGTPPDRVAKLNSVINQVLESDKVKSRLVEAGYQISTMTAPEFQAFVVNEIKRWGEVVKSANLSVK